MSKEFEKVVLKKLEKLDSTERLIEEVILPKLDKVDSTEKLIKEVILPKLDKVDSTEKLIKEVIAPKLEKVDSTVEKVVLPKLDRIDLLEEKMDNTNKIVKELSGEVKSLNNKFTIFDYEINKKIDSLFDAVIVNTEKDSVHEDKIEILDEKIFDHGIRISNLENKIFTT